MNSKRFLIRLHSLVLDSEVGAKMLSREIGKKYQTFMRELNPYDRLAKLGVGDLVLMLRVTRDPEIIDLILDEAGMLESYRSPAMQRDGAAENIIARRRGKE